MAKIMANSDNYRLSRQLQTVKNDSHCSQDSIVSNNWSSKSETRNNFITGINRSKNEDVYPQFKKKF